MPVADTNPAVNKLPPVTFPETAAPTDTKLAEAITLPPDTLAELVILPVADTNPAVNKLPPVTFPDTTAPTDTKLAAATTLPPVILPVATT